ncbi:MAG: hypothetical protein AAF628_02145 [Planctomycetota bacterium]
MNRLPPTRSLHLGIALLCLSLPVAAQQVLVVGDPAAGAEFPSLQLAVDAAAPGDTILVQPGTYDGATITKALHILADGAAVAIGSTVNIQNLPPGATIRLAGFDPPVCQMMVGPAVAVHRCQGPVWIEDCDYRAPTFLSGTISLVVPTTVPELGPGVDTATTLVQAFALDASAGVLGGTGQGVTMLDRVL